MRNSGVGDSGRGRREIMRRLLARSRGADVTRPRSVVSAPVRLRGTARQAPMSPSEFRQVLTTLGHIQTPRRLRSWAARKSHLNFDAGAPLELAPPRPRPRPRPPR